LAALAPPPPQGVVRVAGLAPTPPHGVLRTGLGVNVPVLPPLLPIFPLPNVVLFPRMPLPLHVFEPRYRRMVADALDSHRAIGMVLLQAGWEGDYEGRPPVYPIGCAGLIERCERFEDGRYNLLLKGVARFRVAAERAGFAYRVAEARYSGDILGDLSALDGLRARVSTFLERIGHADTLLDAQSRLPHDVFVNAACQALDLAPVEKQTLLDCDTISLRYARLLEILEFHVLEPPSHRGKGLVH
jgi:Lon protease-like protein